MVDFDPNKDSKFYTADKGTLLATGVGNIPIDLVNSHNSFISSGTITNVMYGPNATANLLSVSQLASKGHIIMFSQKGFDVYDQDKVSIKGTVKFTGSEFGGIYKLDTISDTEKSENENFPSTSKETVNTCNNIVEDNLMSVSKKSNNNVSLWHKRLGHSYTKSLDLLTSMASGIDYQNTEMLPCTTCIEANKTKKSFPKGRATSKLELVHGGLVGPMSEKSWGGARWFSKGTCYLQARVSAWRL
uniref:Uncharacterized protein LOC114348172 n=1 Tax=Diabrotica virgifera virgifera TaxID=50390 RepID=A0A6P7HAA2_DIAVI